MTRDPLEALEAVIDMGIERLLTSGQERSAAEGLDLIAELVQKAAGRTIVMPGGGVTERNLQRILRHTGAREIHGSASGTRESRMTFRNTRIVMGGQLGPPEYSAKVASVDRVRVFRSLAG